MGDYREEGPLRDWILALKSARGPALYVPLARHLAGLVAPALAGDRPTALVPVPLHPLRRLERGHDQVLGLARELSSQLRLPLVRALRRVRFTLPQGAPRSAARGAWSRTSNVAAAFRIERDHLGSLQGAHVWLLDDVVTSAATVQECSRVLKHAGASRVSVLCLAKAEGLP